MVKGLNFSNKSTNQTRDRSNCLSSHVLLLSDVPAKAWPAASQIFEKLFLALFLPLTIR